MFEDIYIDLMCIFNGLVKNLIPFAASQMSCSCTCSSETKARSSHTIPCSMKVMDPEPQTGAMQNWPTMLVQKYAANPRDSIVASRARPMNQYCGDKVQFL
jgi:hypothetical protein